MPMKTMTCKQLGGACDEQFKAETFEQIAELRKNMVWTCLQQGTKRT